MLGQRDFWNVDGRLKGLSAEGDPVERVAKTVDFELFRQNLVEALGRASQKPRIGPIVLQNHRCCRRRGSHRSGQDRRRHAAMVLAQCTRATT